MLGVLPGIIGTLQATEALKLILKIGTPLRGRLLVLDALEMDFRKITFERKPDCRACSGKLVWPHEKPRVLQDIALENFEPTERFQVLDVRSPEEFSHGSLVAVKVKNIPLPELSYRIKELDSLVKTLVVCRSGVRSREAGEYLLKAGFVDVRRLCL